MDTEGQELLSTFTDEELAAELELRGQLAVIVPEAFEDPDPEYLKKLRATAQNHIAAFVDPDIRDKDTAHYMYEYVMQMFYGPNIFQTFINPNLR